MRRQEQREAAENMPEFVKNTYVQPRLQKEKQNEVTCDSSCCDYCIRF